MLTISYFLEHGKNCAFTLSGCIFLDVCGIIIITMYFIGIYIDSKNKERTLKNMKRKKNVGKIIYENNAGAVIFVYEESEYYVYEKVEGRLIKCFEVPTVDEGVRYLKSL